MIAPQTVAAGTLRVGDEVYNSHAYHPTAAWVRVIGVDIVGHEVWVETDTWQTILHVMEAIAVLREERKVGVPSESAATI